MGWSDRAARLTAIARLAAGSPARLTKSVWAGRPVVMVPVLSRTRVCMAWPCSRNRPPLIRMPRRAAAARPLTTETGVEMTRAQGQAMTKMTSAL